MAGIYEHGESSYLQNEDFDIPPGFRFSPTDKEVMQYLTNKLKGSLEYYNHIPVVDIYEYSPMELSVKYKLDGESEGYFFTPRSRKYPNGHRPDRFTKTGYWKPTSSGSFITDGGRNIGYVRTLKYFQGYEKNKSNHATIWLMQEYAPDNGNNFYEWAVVKIYTKRGASNKIHGAVEAENNSTGCPESANQSPNQYLSFDSELLGQTRSYYPTPKPIQIVEPPDQSVLVECVYNHLGHTNHNPNNFTEEVQLVAQAQPICRAPEVEAASMESFYNELGEINMNPSYGNFDLDFSDQVNQAHLPLLQLPGLEQDPPQFSEDQTQLKNQESDSLWLDNVLEYLDPFDMIIADQGEISGLSANSHLPNLFS